MQQKIIETRISKKKPKNVLAGAIFLAIENAEIFKTPLVIKGKDGRIKLVSPSQMKRIVARAK